MPTYLRWIAAITTGITAQFAYFMLVGAIALGTGNEQIDLRGAAGLVITLGSTFVGVLPALAINDWLARRYPRERERASSQ